MLPRLIAPSTDIGILSASAITLLSSFGGIDANTIVPNLTLRPSPWAKSLTLITVGFFESTFGVLALSYLMNMTPRAAASLFASFREPTAHPPRNADE